MQAVQTAQLAIHKRATLMKCKALRHTTGGTGRPHVHLSAVQRSVSIYGKEQTFTSTDHTRR